MGGSSALSGSIGKAVISNTLVTRLTMWRINPSVSLSEWGDSDSAGYTNALAARRGCKGSISGKFDTSKKPYAVFREGDNPTLALWQSAAAGDYWAFPSVIIESFELELNPDTKEVVAWTANWTADGIFYAPGQSGAPSYSLPGS